MMIGNIQSPRITGCLFLMFSSLHVLTLHVVVLCSCSFSMVTEPLHRWRQKSSTPSTSLACKIVTATSWLWYKKKKIFFIL